MLKGRLWHILLKSIVAYHAKGHCMGIVAYLAKGLCGLSCQKHTVVYHEKAPWPIMKKGIVAYHAKRAIDKYVQLCAMFMHAD